MSNTTHHHSLTDNLDRTIGRAIAAVAGAGMLTALAFAIASAAGAVH